MSIELTMLAWTAVLGIAQVLLAAACKRRQDGLKWGAGSRDTPPPAYTGVAGRLERATKNLLETFPFFAAAILVAHGAGREGSSTALGAQLYFWCRVAYVPLYAAGIPLVRSLAWGLSLLGLCLVLAACL